ncbi:hypothetical protein D3C73_1246480 [compost metagenome]
MHQHGGVHLGTQVLQRVRQPAGQPLSRSFIVVAQKRNQPAQVGAGFVIPDRFERQAIKGVDVHRRILAHSRIKHDMFDIHSAPLATVQPQRIRVTQCHLHRALGDTPLLFTVPDILGAIDVHVSVSRWHAQRTALLARHASCLFDVADMIICNQPFARVIQPRLGERLAHPSFER